MKNSSRVGTEEKIYNEGDTNYISNKTISNFQIY
jgi:hypothetical protein